MNRSSCTQQITLQNNWSIWYFQRQRWGAPGEMPTNIHTFASSFFGLWRCLGVLGAVLGTECSGAQDRRDVALLGLWAQKRIWILTGRDWCCLRSFWDVASLIFSQTLPSLSLNQSNLDSPKESCDIDEGIHRASGNMRSHLTLHLHRPLEYLSPTHLGKNLIQITNS